MNTKTDVSDHLHDWVSLGAVLVKTNTRREYAALHDTVECGGIFRLDSFDRAVFHPKDSLEARKALELILDVWNYQSGRVSLGDDEPPPYDDFGGEDSLFVLHGWTKEKLPKFIERADSIQIDRPAHRSGETKKRTTLLTLIAALLHSKNLDPHDKDTTSKLTSIVDRAGRSLDEGTVRGILDELRNPERQRTAKPS